MTLTLQQTIEPRSKDLRSFGILLASIFTVIGLLPLLHQAQIRWWALVLVGPFLLPAVLRPRLLVQPYRTWMRFALLLGLINSRLILGIIFLLVILPMGIVRRIFGLASFTTRPNPSAISYFEPLLCRSREHLKRQF